MENEQIDTAVKALKAVQELDPVVHQDEIRRLTSDAIQRIDHARVGEYDLDPMVDIEVPDHDIPVHGEVVEKDD